MRTISGLFSAPIALCASLVFFSCTNSSDQNHTPEEKTGQGGRVYGKTLRVNENEPLQTLYPHAITDLISIHVASQIYEGLVKINSRDLSIGPGIASHWELDPSGTVYTFHLKRGVMFQDDPCFPAGKGREVTAADVKYSFELLCTPSANNFAYATTFNNRVLGATRFYEASLSGKPEESLQGVKVIDNYTVQIILEKPSSSFLYMLAQPAGYIVAREAVEMYGNMLHNGTGAFRYVNTSKPDEHVILVRNETYHGTDELGNQLPFLDSVIFTFVASKKAELDAFQEGKLDIIIGLPSESIKEVVEQQISQFQNKPPKYVLDRSPEMATHYYDLNLANSVFKNKKVRQAFAYAIDREKILNDVLKGEGYGPGIYGISPPSFPKYDITQIKGYSYDPEKARKLLAEAGYPGGKNFPPVKLSLNSGGSKNTNVALEIAKQLRDVLNVSLELEIVPFATKLNDAKYARRDMFRSAWIADYPSPESFLVLFYGKNIPASLNEPSFPNVTRYSNPEFDALYEKGLEALSREESYEYFMQAEQIVMQDAPVIVLWYDEKYRLYQGDIQNFFANPMNYWDFSLIYKKAMKMGESQTSQKK